MCAVFDPRKEISIAATEGLRSTIPQSKHGNTINYVRLGIIEYVDHHLSTLFDASGGLLTKEPSAEEDSESFSRICNTNLLLVSHMAETLSIDDLSKISSQLRDLMDNHLWRMQQSADPKVRASFYTLLTNLLPHTQFVTPILESISKIIIASITDVHMQTQDQAWAALISLLSTYPQLFSIPWFTLKKSMLPAIMDAIKSPKANESTFHALLPLLSKIPTEALSTPILDTFFSRLWKALKHEAIIETVISTYFECLIYVIVKVDLDTRLQLLNTHFIPIFSGYFTYSKDLSPNITHAMALFVSRLEAKTEMKLGLVEHIWLKLQELAQAPFILSSNQLDRPGSADKAAAKLFSEKLVKFLVQFEITQRETKQSGECSSLTHFFTLLLAPSMQHLLDLGLTEQAQCVSELGPIWRSMASLTMVQERKKTEAADYIASHQNAPHYITDLVSSALKSSLHISVDNIEWQYLLKGLLQQRDMRSIKSFVESNSSKDVSFWRCYELEQLALEQASFQILAMETPADSNDVCILPFLIRFLPDDVLSQLLPRIIQAAATPKSTWTSQFITNIVASVGAIGIAIARSQMETTLLLNLIFDWILTSDKSLSEANKDRLQSSSVHCLEGMLPEMMKAQSELSFDHLVSLVRNHLSQIMQSVHGNEEHNELVNTMATLNSSIIKIVQQSSRPMALNLISRLLLSDDEWVFVTTALNSQRTVDAFGHNIFHNPSSLPRSSVPSSSVVHSCTTLLDYSIHLLSNVPCLEAIASDVAFESPESILNESLPFAEPHCDSRIVSQVSRLLICDAILSYSPSASRDTSATQRLRTVAASLSSLLDEIMLPSLLLHTPSGSFQQIAHAISNYASNHLAIAQIDRCLNFIASTPLLGDHIRSFIISHLWNQLLYATPKHAAMIASLNHTKWVSYLSQESSKLAISKALSELYQLKPTPSDSNLYEVSDSLGYQLLIVSQLLAYGSETIADPRKVFEVFSFACKYGFFLFSSHSLSHTDTRFLVGLTKFISQVVLNAKFGWKLSEANYSVIFDLTEKLASKSKAKDPSELNVLSYNVMVLLDGLCEHMFALGVTNVDWANFVITTIGPFISIWRELPRTVDHWSESYMRRWSRVMRFANPSCALKLDGDAFSDLYDTIRLATDLRVQCATYPLLLAHIREHNANTFTKQLSSSSKLSVASESSTSSENSIDAIGDEMLDSKVLPDALQHVVMDVNVGYSEPLELDDLDLHCSDDVHVAMVCVSACASTLFGWRLVLEYLNSKDEKEKSDVSTWIRQSGLLHLLLPLLCTLVDLERPPKISAEVLLERHIQNTAFGSVEASDWRGEEDVPDAYNILRELALFLLRDLFEYVPVLVRSWWQQADGQLKAAIESFVAKQVSPQLVQKELARVSEWRPASPLLVEDFNMKASAPHIGEVMATYRKDEVELSMTLKLSPAHPLKPVTVTMSHKSVTDALWRKWLLSMRSLLLTRDGSVLDAVLLWRGYLDKHFEGVECCPICYAIFHISNYSLPDLACKTCRNKFHKACLYKWFNTSHHNECPLCKTPFN